jgi:hypothetical protein
MVGCTGIADDADFLLVLLNVVLVEKGGSAVVVQKGANGRD